MGALEKNARSRVERTFKVFPYTRSTTTIFEMQDLESLQKMMIDEEMTEEDLAECRKVSPTLLHWYLKYFSEIKNILGYLHPAQQGGEGRHAAGALANHWG